MEILSHPLIYSRRSQRLIGALLLFVLSFALLGIPLAAPPTPARNVAGAQSGERFPCEDCACGCATAEYCWDRCCCHSDREKLQWAAEHQVTPPAFLVARANQVTAQTEACDLSTPKCCCCQAKPDVATVSEPASASQPASATKSASDVSEHAMASVLVWKAFECRGLQSLWSMLSCVVVSMHPAATASSPPIIERIRLLDDLATAIRDCPDPPVP
ncbi:hypothetical protein [Rubripirellula amarantea]|uniref:hypothetical protein n=1 Tax=Rubripirellula amarantea TaxID=2527999 RepID=UPI0011B46655|nr:hypothetical protein [Rubripirellula amarantea]